MEPRAWYIETSAFISEPNTAFLTLVFQTPDHEKDAPIVYKEYRILL